MVLSEELLLLVTSDEVPLVEESVTFVVVVFSVFFKSQETIKTVNPSKNRNIDIFFIKTSKQYNNYTTITKKMQFNLTCIFVFFYYYCLEPPNWFIC